ncbi:MAG TPA: sodium:proton antiporter [Humidesulfovibrio sp.]|nr:sodium:proton antiporter [Humidesulfovibrio sp.]HWR05079.1 sodium:proton antiporter [Humidesulfovibrio sp.]
MIIFAAASLLCLDAAPALASGGQAMLDGSALSLWWAMPFACMLLSIAILPLTLPVIWAEHFGKIALFWALTFIVPCAVLFGPGLAFTELAHTLVLEYLPFLILLFALFTISGGVRLTGSLSGKPASNTVILAIGTLLSSVMGTTGASMLLIRPLLRANEHREHKVHTVVFFIFLVSNIGGSLTPLGDPPLFLGFLKGVSFFWTTTHLFSEMLFASGTLLVLYYLLDLRMMRKETPRGPLKGRRHALRLEGGVNMLLLLGVVGAVLLSGIWKPEIEFPAGPVIIALQDLTRDGLLLALAGLSLLLTAKETREQNSFSWEPIEEVAKLFFGIFVTMIPAITMLKAGPSGAMREVIALVSHDGVAVNHMYFWLSGILSSFLDNAPTYLVFFNTAGGDAAQLMAEAPLTLAAISCGSVFMGANSYIGNAPNFMVRSIAESQGVKMPSFFGYMAWSVGILIPLFLLVTVIFFRA